MLTCLVRPKGENAKMGELNEKYTDTIKQLDEWIKSYIKKVCIGFKAEVVELYVEADLDDKITVKKKEFEKYKIENNLSRLQWGFFVKKSVKNKSFTTLMRIFLEILAEKIPSVVALDELANILSYVKGKDCAVYKRQEIKSSLFDKITNEKLIQNYVDKVMAGMPDKEIFIQLSALNYENRVTHTHLIFGTKRFFSKPGNDGIVFDKAMDFEIEKIRLIRKLMEISRETYGLVVKKQSDSKWYIKGATPLKKAEKAYQVEFSGHSVWKFKYGKEELFEYREGNYKMPPIGTVGDIYDKEYGKLANAISDKEKCEKVEAVIRKIRKVASHGTGMIFIEEPEDRKSVLKEEIERLAKFGKAYAIMAHSLKLTKDTPDEVLKGITAVDGAVFCNFDAECKAFGVIVDGETVKEGDPGRGARYSSLTNYVEWLNSNKRNANVKCIAVVMSEDGPLNIEENLPEQSKPQDSVK